MSDGQIRVTVQKSIIGANAIFKFSRLRYEKDFICRNI
jgi:hypothetical protein